MIISFPLQYLTYVYVSINACQSKKKRTINLKETCKEIFKLVAF